MRVEGRRERIELIRIQVPVQVERQGRRAMSVSATGLYTYTWKTDKAWAETCRTLTVKLADGHVARFKFK